MADSATSPSPDPTIAADRMARMAGIMLLAMAVLTVIMVYARVSADADQATMVESLQAMADNSAMFGLSGLMRFLSGLTFTAAGLLLLRTWIIRERWATPLVPYLFVFSGILTAVSGALAVFIVTGPSLETVLATGPSMSSEYTGLGAIYHLRWITGKIGFTAAGLALIVAARYQWQVGGILRRVAPGSAILGVAMQFIWVDSATILHPIIGTVFFIWLLVIGTMLSTGRVERHFISAYRRNA